MRDETRRLIVGAWAVACIATAGSLYYSLGLGLYPCTLCWYQRILMYPLVVVLGYAAVVKPSDIHRIVLPLSIPGLGIALFHSLLQLQPSTTCSIGGCGSIQFRLAGVLTIPNQSALGFALITAAMLWTWRTYRSR